MVTLHLPIKPFSINQMNCRDARFKTQAYRDWATEVLARLDEHKELHELALDHQASGGTFEVELVAEFPEHVFYNKDGAVSSKTIDCSNFEKPLIDLVFGHTMDVNDKFITKLISSKRPGAAYGIKMTIRLLLR